MAKDAPELASLDAGLLASAKRLDVDVSGFDWHANVYVVTPKSDSPVGSKLAIVHGGHMPEGPANYLAFGLCDTVNQLLRDGYVVAIIQMPLVGWNRDADGVIEGKKFEIRQRSVAGHDELFSKVEPTLKAGTMRFFLEPITQALNELLAEHPSPKQTLMIGLSGGGWTTHLYAAVDPRIDVSIPVAGALPMYARPFSPGSAGDSEQEYGLIFREEDSNKDGVLDRATGIASWLEVFALGGIAPEGWPSSQADPGAESIRFVLLQRRRLQNLRRTAQATDQRHQPRRLVDLHRRHSPEPSDLAACPEEPAGKGGRTVAP